MKLLVTGGAGFIGSTYVRRHLAEHPDDRIVVLDKLTYAGRTENLATVPRRSAVDFIEGDIADPEAVARAIDGCDAVVNFAAESHVDRSIEDPGAFIQTDVFGTYVLLEAARDAGIRHLQISTDEVYGSIDEGTFTEQSPIEPSSPYSASKAGGDMIVRAFNHTYGADCLIVRASNNYGPFQHPEKLIPLMILNAMAGDRLPVYGDGMQVRNWLFTEDFAAAIDVVLERGEAGEVYNVGGPEEMPNIDVVTRILELTGRDESQIDYVADRLGHDRRYSLSSDRTEGLGWRRAGRLRRGNRAHGRLVSRAPGVVGADPLRRVPRVLRAPVRHEARRLSDRHGRDPHRRPRRDRADRLRRRARLPDRELQRRALARARHRRGRSSRRTTRARPSAGPCAACTSRPTPARASSSAARAARSSTSPSTSVAARRPTASGRDTSSTTSVTVSSGSRSASRHGFQVLSEVADVAYKLTSLYDPETESEIAWDDPDVGIEWPVEDPLLSDRDEGAPRLAEVADRLPFTD